MFKNAAAKIAHNTTIPGLGANEFRQLQDLISQEKSVLISLQRLSSDLTKANEALRTWGLAEGVDLGDVLDSSANLLAGWATALSQYASHEHAIRDQMKAIRTREEDLEDLRRRRRAVTSKADSAERKLNRMSPEHKNFAAQTELLNNLRRDISEMDAKILHDEASVGDFKRTSAKAFLSIKFGGLLELSEKGVIVAEYGNLITAEIPEETTPPGGQRSWYRGQPTVEQMVSEATRALSDVTFNAGPFRPAHATHNPAAQQSELDPHAANGSTYLPHPEVGGHFMDSSQMGSDPSTPLSPTGLQSPTASSGAPEPSVGMMRERHSMGNLTPHAHPDEDFNPSADAGDARFATFPLQPRDPHVVPEGPPLEQPQYAAHRDSGYGPAPAHTLNEQTLHNLPSYSLSDRPAYTTEPQNYGLVAPPPPAPPPHDDESCNGHPSPPRLGTQDDIGDDFSASIVAALGTAAGQGPGQWTQPQTAAQSTYAAPPGPPPVQQQYAASAGPPPNVGYSPPQTTLLSGVPSMPPNGGEGHHESWPPPRDVGSQVSGALNVLQTGSRPTSMASSVGLAYLNNNSANDETLETHSEPPLTPPPPAQEYNLAEKPFKNSTPDFISNMPGAFRNHSRSRDEQHVQFGSVRHVDDGSISQPEYPVHAPSAVSHSQSLPKPPLRQSQSGSPEIVEVRRSESPATTDPRLSMRMPEPVRMPEPEVGMRSPQRVPVPAFVLEEDEPARNAAAARAVGFELDSMLAQFPSNPYRKDSLKPDQSPEQRSSSPLAPPEAPFARPQPVLDMARVPSIDPPQYSPPRSPVIARSNLSGGSNNRQSSLFSGSQPSRPAFTRPGGTGPLPQGSRTISAAAFKRPAARRDSVGSAEQQSNIDSTPPLHFQKRVSSGQPAQASSSPWARTTLPLPPHETTDDEEFDYVGAYSQDSQYVRDDAGLR